MKCYIHRDRDAVASCTKCGNLICEECRVFIDGKNVCKNCLAQESTKNTWFTNDGQPFKPANSGFNINISTVSKVLLYVAIIFSAIEIINRVVGFSHNILTSILYLNFGVNNIILQLCNLMIIGTFAILLVVNLSKLMRIRFVNESNIGAITAIGVALLVLACLVYAVFNMHVGFFDMIMANLRDMGVFIPLVATLVNIFGIYKHKLNININY